MVEGWRLAIGGAAVLLGLAWIAAPIRMSRLQSKVLYLGYGREVEESSRDAMIGRVGGAILAVLGIILASGVTL